MVEGAEFVRAVMRHLGVAGPTDLVKAMGWGPNSPRKVSRWLAGETAPDHEATMEMLERCGWLAVDAPQGRVSAEELSAGEVQETRAMMEEALQNQRQQRDDLEALAASVAQLSEDLKATAEDVGRALSILEALPDKKTQQSKRR